MDNNNMNNELQFKDFPATQIQDKLQQCLNYEAKYGKNLHVTAWINWCNSYDYRKNEWEFRQNIAKSIKSNTNYGI